MSSFEAAVEVVLDHEGGLDDDPDDPGGVTNWGLTMDDLRRYGYANPTRNDIINLTRETARLIWKKLYWDLYQYGLIEDQELATKVFDICANQGPHEAHLMAQRALAAVGQHVAQDGRLGPISIKALNTAPKAGLLPAMRSEAAGIYRMIAAHQAKAQKFLVGWLRRAYS
jgi:type VI secretion system secreted protein VgrG